MAISKSQHLIGKVLGSCVLEKLLGHGGSSAVFLAQQLSPERKVAVKVFLPRMPMDIETQREFYSRFLHEAESASKLDHPNILPIYAYGEQDGIPYIVMPYMEGGTLSEYMTEHGPLSLLDAQWYLEQMSAALDYAHAHGCVHCDVKPANILLDSDGHVMLSDFGISRVTQTDGEQSEIKGPRSLMGTPDYISPEQAMGKALDGRSDIYSLGITLFYLLARRLPFRADSAIALALLHVHEEPPSLALIRGDVSPAIDQVVQRALAKNPDDRFQSANAFSVAFADAIAEAETAELAATNHKRSSPPSLASLVIYKPDARSSKGLTVSIPRLLIIASLLLALLVGAVGFSARYMGSLLGRNGHAQTNALPPHSTPASPTVSASHDYLTNDGWPGRPTFVYDAQQHNYHVRNRSNQVVIAPYRGRTFGDFRLTISMSEVRRIASRGNDATGMDDQADYYGVVFRCKEDLSNYYLFAIATSGSEQYEFLRFDGVQWNSLSEGGAPSLVTGIGKNNTITIEAQGNTFSFLINGKTIGKPVTDTAKGRLTVGEIGLYVEESSEVAFSHLYIV